MRRLLFLIALISPLFPASLFSATRNFHVQIKSDKFTNKHVYLTYYNTDPYRQGLAIQDSFFFNAKGEVDTTIKKIPQGLYTLVVPLGGRKNLLKDLLFDKDSTIRFTMDSTNELHFPKGSDNDIFYTIARHLGELNQQLNVWNARVRDTTKNKKEKNRALDSSEHYSAQLKKDLQNFIHAHPTHIFTLLNSLVSSNLPSTQNLHSQGDTLSYRYNLKNHFFNIVSWSDPRLQRLSVVYDNVNNYLNNIVENNRDSLIKYTDKFMGVLAKKNKPLFYELATYLNLKYVRYAPFIGSDGIFYHIYEKYLAKEKNTDIHSVQRMRLQQMGEMVEDNQIGNAAPNFLLVDLKGNAYTIKDLKPAKFYLVAFWDPNCHHCRIAIPALDSIMFRAGWAEKNNISAISISLDGDAGLAKFIADKKLDSRWKQLFDTRDTRTMNATKNIKNFRIAFGIFQTPTFYLLDANKRILAKNMGYRQITGILKILGASEP